MRFKKIFFSLVLSLFAAHSYAHINRLYGDPRYGTHMVPLMTVIAHTKGPILELGCGDYSTPLMHALCSSTKRYILSTETDSPWLNLFLYLQTPWHEFVHVTSYDEWKNVGNEKFWSVVLVDHKPIEQRIKDIQRLRPCTEIFVVHDTEADIYGYEPIFATFKYRYDYRKYIPYTTVVSDTIDVREFFQD